MYSFLKITGLIVYSLLVELIYILLRLIQPFSTSVAKFLSDRKDNIAGKISKNSGVKTVLFFCSSAGEFEQAKPLIERYHKNPDYFVYVLFFSQSGISYAKSRGEELPYSKSPIDSLWRWRKLISILSPDICIVVKYEFWPVAVAEMRRQSQMVLIDAVVGTRLPKSKIARILRGLFLQSFDKIFVVCEDDRRFYIDQLSIPDVKVFVAGDTKYDRVRERAEISQENSKALSEELNAIIGGSLRLVLGSAWPDDVVLMAESFSNIRTKLRNNWKIVIVPHLIDNVMITKIALICKKYDIKYLIYSEFKNGKTALPPSIEVLIMDKMGMLAELYSCCHAAYVGGAIHHQVHNILEPSVRGLYTVFGPKFQNSHEAIIISKLGLVDVVKNTDELSNWWNKIDENNGQLNLKLKDLVYSFCGASNYIIREAER